MTKSLRRKAVETMAATLGIDAQILRKVSITILLVLAVCSIVILSSMRRINFFPSPSGIIIAGIIGFFLGMICIIPATLKHNGGLEKPAVIVF